MRMTLVRTIWNAAVFSAVVSAALGAMVARGGEEEPANPFVVVCKRALARQGEAPMSEAARRVRDAMVGFGFDLHRDIASLDQNKSLVTSPFSITMFLALLDAAADGASRLEIRAALGLQGMDLEMFVEGTSELARALRTVSDKVTLTFGNLSILTDRLRYDPKFLKLVSDRYSAESVLANFADPEGLRNEVNKYISDQTHGMIPELLQPGDEPKVWALVNAGYFKGSWAVEFDPRRTDENARWQLPDGSTKPVPQMRMSDGTYLRYWQPDFQVFSLLYDGAEFAMDVILPTVQDGETPGEALERVQKLFSQVNYQKWIQESQPDEIEILGLPRWKASSVLKAEFLEALKKRLPKTMSDERVLTRMAEGQNLSKLGVAIHGAMLGTDEFGSEGGFVTFGGGMESMPMPVMVDHPFIAVVRHVDTGMPVFAITERNPYPLPPPKDQAHLEPQAQLDPEQDLSRDVPFAREPLMFEPYIPPQNAGRPSLSEVVLKLAIADLVEHQPDPAQVDALLRVVSRGSVSLGFLADAEADRDTKYRAALKSIRENGWGPAFLELLTQHGGGVPIAEALSAYLTDDIGR